MSNGWIVVDGSKERMQMQYVLLAVLRDKICNLIYLIDLFIV